MAETAAETAYRLAQEAKQAAHDARKKKTQEDHKKGEANG